MLSIDEKNSSSRQFQLTLSQNSPHSVVYYRNQVWMRSCLDEFTSFNPESSDRLSRTWDVWWGEWGDWKPRTWTQKLFRCFDSSDGDLSRHEELEADGGCNKATVEKASGQSLLLEWTSLCFSILIWPQRSPQYSLRGFEAVPLWFPDPIQPCCYESQLGDVESAKVRIGEAIKLDPKWKTQALDDPDLEPMWDSWSWGRLIRIFPIKPPDLPCNKFSCE